MQPRKRFGQHFLTDHHIIDKIITAINPKPEDHLVEIGPGQGALTSPLLKIHPHLTVIEIDRDLVSLLQQNFKDNIKIYQHDVLKFDFNQLKISPLRIIGNLPYNISTPLLFHLLKYNHHIKDLYFMLQKEVVDRLSAAPHSKTYGRLSVMIQQDFDVTPLFSVPRESFYPIPNVDSAVVKLTPRISPLHIINPVLFEDIVRAAFQQRRKTLKNALKTYLTREILIKCNLDAALRPEALTGDEYVKLANHIAGNKER